MRALCVMEAHIFDHGFVVEEKQWQDMLAGMLFIVQVCVNKERACVLIEPAYSSSQQRTLILPTLTCSLPRAHWHEMHESSAWHGSSTEQGKGATRAQQRHPTHAHTSCTHHVQRHHCGAWCWLQKP